MSLLIALPLAFVLGLLAFVLLPVVGAGVGWRAPSRMMFVLATMPIRRMGIVVSEHNDILAKPMRFNSLGVERITIGGTEKSFEDPANRLHEWLGIPFALADENAGVLFDPRDAALGQEKRKLDERDEAEFYATDEEYDQMGIQRWVPGAFTLPSAHQIVDLSAAKELVTGGERSEHPKRVEELYKHSRDPLSDGASLLKLFLPVAALFGVFAGFWFLASQLGGGGGGGGSTVSFGLLTLLAMPSRVPSWLKKLGGILLVVGLTVGAVVGLLLFTGILTTLLSVVAFGAGLLFLPILAQLGRVSDAVAGRFLDVFMKMGFLPYKKPVLCWTPEQYEVIEAADLPETAPDPTWYGIFGTRIGFSYAPGVESWGEAGVTNDKLAAYKSELATDGGETTSNVPSQRYEQAEELGPDGMGGFIPASREGYGVLTDIALGWWANSADGTKSMRRLLEAKEQFGGDNPPVSDKTIAYLTFAGGGVGFIMGVVVFFVL